LRPRLAIHCISVATVLLAGTGCASTAKRAEADLRKRQAQSHYDLAVDHIQNGRLELGLRDLLAAERLDPRDERVQNTLGVAYYQKGRVAEGESHLLQALELRPDYHDARYNLTVMLLRESRWSECIAQSQLLFDDPTFVAPWRALTTRGWCEYKSGNVAEARRLLERSRDYDSRDWSTLLNLGILEADQGNRRQAVELLEQVLSLRPGTGPEAEANYRLGELYASLGERERAVSHLTTALEKAPNGPWGKKSEESLRRLR
jgi:tetratricopeptide (TPR) repeat protein